MSLMLRMVLRRFSPAALVFGFLVIAPWGATQDAPEAQHSMTGATGTSSENGLAASTGAALPVTRPGRSPAGSPAVSFGIVIDSSKSMRAAPGAIRSAVDKLLKPMGDDDEAFVYVAKDKPELVQDFTVDTQEVDRKVDRLRMKGKAALFDTLMAALNHLEDASNERTALIVIASGEDGVSSTSLDALRQKLAASRTPVYCIASKRTSWDSQSVLQQIASSSHGSALFPRDDKDYANASAEISRRMFGEGALAAKEKPLASYDLAVVKSIPVANGRETADFPDGDNVILQKMLVKNLRAKGLFSQVIDDTTPDGVDQTKSATQDGSAPLEVMGTVVEYKPATERQARFIRLGGRSALVKVQFIFRDARTRKIVMTSIAEGKVDTGVLGGSAEKVDTQAELRAIDKVVNDIARSR